MNYPPYGTNSNELSPRYDSGMDNRVSQARSNNYGPLGDLEDKLDPRYDSGLDYRSPGGLRGNREFSSTYSDSRDPSHQTGPRSQPIHDSSLLNKLDPRVDAKHGTRKF